MIWPSARVAAYSGHGPSSLARPAPIVSVPQPPIQPFRTDDLESHGIAWKRTETDGTIPNCGEYRSEWRTVARVFVANPPLYDHSRPSWPLGARYPLLSAEVWLTRGRTRSIIAHKESIPCNSTGMEAAQATTFQPPAEGRFCFGAKRGCPDVSGPDGSPRRSCSFSRRFGGRPVPVARAGMPQGLFHHTNSGCTAAGASRPFPEGRLASLCRR